MYIHFYLNRNRYHVDDKPGKFGQFKPGVISKDLQNALGLRSSEVPMHIYQMRLLGYPPGYKKNKLYNLFHFLKKFIYQYCFLCSWIEDITEYSSGLNFFDTPNSPSSGYPEKVSFDLSRIIDFPGFNCRLPDRYKDVCLFFHLFLCRCLNKFLFLFIKDYRYLKFPPMQDCHSKKALIKQLKNKMKQSKKRFRSPESNSREETVSVSFVIKHTCKIFLIEFIFVYSNRKL